MPHAHGDLALRYRAKRRSGEGVACGVLVAAALALAGCGTGGLVVGGDPALLEPLTTGSLADARSPGLGLDRAAYARASAALAEALDPLGPGAPVAWSDPESGARGTIAAAAGPTVEDDLVCRRFRAESTVGGRPSSRHVGHACRIAAATWRIEAAEPATVEEDDTRTDERLPVDLMPEHPG